jgi:predicted 3-demethylubiquinone-9 3-methyltransferase (glyoxalase superfamily)
MTNKISPFLWFDDQAEEAARFYVSVFRNSKVLEVTPGGPNGKAMTVTFELEGQRVIGLNAGPQFTFNESFSFLVSCEDQAEVDDLWAKLTANGGEESQCGWLKDRYGLSWQIIPTALYAALGDKDPQRAKRALEAMLTMKKIDIKALEAARQG